MQGDARAADLIVGPLVTEPAIETSERSIGDGSMLEALLATVAKHQPQADPGPIERAFEVGRRAHDGQVRRSGEPYLVHPVRVAQLLASLGIDTCSVVAGLLHDAVEDSELSVYDLTEQFGREVASIVDGVTKLGKVPYLSRQEQQAESFRKMLLAMSQDIRVLLVKLVDRLDNMRTLEHMPPDKRERISRETMEIYAPLSNRLGIEVLRRELQDLSFRYLEPAAYAAVRSSMDRLLAAEPMFVERGIDSLRAAFGPVALDVAAAPPRPRGDDVRWDPDMGGPVQVRATLRPPYRVHAKRAASGRNVEQVSDLVTYQVVTADRAACYTALGVLHSRFKPVPGRFRDYVALPRPNHYRALHTSVVDRKGRRMEVQIRSEHMDAVAERGIVAHWQPEQGTEDRRGLAWLGQLMDWQEQVTDPTEFIAAVKADLFADEVYVFTPEGDIHTFPKGATPIDFAFAIHTDLGLHCSGARVNGQVVPLRYRLRQGDTIEILTNPNHGPREEWLKMSASSRARARIKQYLRQQKRKHLRTVGRSLVEQAVARRGRELDDVESRGLVAAQAEQLGLGRDARGADGVYEAVGAGEVEGNRVASLLVPSGARETPTDSDDRNLFARMLRRVAGRGTGAARPPGATEGLSGAPIVINRERVEGAAGGDGMIQLASCCSPVPGDPLVGFFEPGRGLVAHVQGCPAALEHLSERRVHLAWESGLNLDCPVTIEVRTANTVGLLAEMSRAFSHHGVNIKQANCRSFDADRAINTFHATVRGLSQLESLMLTLKDIPGVLAVERVFSAA